MRTKTEMLDRIAEEYVCEAECIFSKLQELLRSETFSSDDMRALRDCAYTLGDFADETAMNLIMFWTMTTDLRIDMTR